MEDGCGFWLLSRYVLVHDISLSLDKHKDFLNETRRHEATKSLKNGYSADISGLGLITAYLHWDPCHLNGRGVFSRQCLSNFVFSSITMGFATLWTPFPSLTSDKFLSRGCAGQVFAITANVVFECPTQFTDPAPEQLYESEESIQKLEREKSVYKVLMQNQHKNIVRGILLAPEGIFMQLLECTLQTRLATHTDSLINAERQIQWI